MHACEENNGASKDQRSVLIAMSVNRVEESEGRKEFYAVCLQGNSLNYFIWFPPIKFESVFSAALMSLVRLELLTNKISNNCHNTINFCTIFIGYNFAVDKLSNIRKSNFLIFLVDKTYTLVVYLSTR